MREIIDPKSGLGLVEASTSLEMSDCIYEVCFFLFWLGEPDRREILAEQSGAPV